MLSHTTILKLLPYFIAAVSKVAAQASGTGATTRYWDCCKPSCAWPGKASVGSPVGICDVHNSPLTDQNAQSGCNGGTSYMCANQSPWAVSDSLAYGYAAVNIAGGSESSWCCACYELTFTSGTVAGKKMIVQATNTGGDLGSNQFDLAIPGGGFGIFNGCTAEWGTPAGGWGAQYGGVSSRSQCDSFAQPLQAGCYWRFDWFANADNPGVTFKQVTCPAALTAKTGCVRSGETPTGPSSVGSSSGASSQTSSNSGSAPKPSTTTSTGSGTAQQYGQCGGINWTGPTSCTAGNACQRLNDYYYQCLPSGVSYTPSSTAQTPPASSTKGATTTITRANTSQGVLNPTNTNTAPTSSSGAGSGAAAQYAQCGGQGWTGPTTCTVGNKCQKQNDYYSQCLPDTSSSSSGNVSQRYQQCGGKQWTGPTTCAAPYTCQKKDDYYSQCL